MARSMPTPAVEVANIDHKAEVRNQSCNCCASTNRPSIQLSRRKIRELHWKTLASMETEMRLYAKKRLHTHLQRHSLFNWEGALGKVCRCGSADCVAATSVRYLGDGPEASIAASIAATAKEHATPLVTSIVSEEEFARSFRPTEQELPIADTVSLKPKMQ
jgi:hypothetical protein